MKNKRKQFCQKIKSVLKFGISSGRDGGGGRGGVYHHNNGQTYIFALGLKNRGEIFLEIPGEESGTFVVKAENKKYSQNY